jgi:hypothetical protein
MVIALIGIGSWIVAVVLLLCILGEIRRTKRELELTMIELDEAAGSAGAAGSAADQIERGPPPPAAPRQWLN